MYTNEICTAVAYAIENVLNQTPKILDSFSAIDKRQNTCP